MKEITGQKLNASDSIIALSICLIGIFADAKIGNSASLNLHQMLIGK